MCQNGVNHFREILRDATNDAPHEQSPESPTEPPPAIPNALPNDRHAFDERFSARCDLPPDIAGALSAFAPAVTAIEIIPPRRTTREAAALETGMAALAHALNQPIALEITGTMRSRRFVARATHAATLSQLAHQLQARYPQAVIRPLAAEDDPLRLEPGETVAALELRPGAAPYLPLRTPGVRESAQEGADPLLGLLAAFNGASAEQRIIAQLALLPAPATWSTPHQRLAVEHPLEPEREQERWEMAQARMAGYANGPSLSLPGVLGLLALVGLVFLVWRNASRFPSWLRQDTTALLHRQVIHLTEGQIIWLVGWAAALLATLLGVLLFTAWVRGRIRAWLRNTPLYDQRLVQEKTMRVAYRARLRVLIIGQDTCPESCDDTFAVCNEAASPHAFKGSAAERSTLLLKVGGQRKTRSLRAQIQRRSHQSQQTREMRQVLEGFIGAYRQFHLATGAYFAPCWVSARAAYRLIPRSAHAQGQQRGWPLRHWWRLLWLFSFLAEFRTHGWQCGLRRSAHMLSVADVAALWHLPQADDLDDLPFVEHTRARTLLAPDTLTYPRAGFRIGTSSHARHTLPVYLPPDASRRNALAIAKTGKGKSTLLLALAQAALNEEVGLVLIDPHGDLVESALALIPEDRSEETLLVDLGDREHPIGLNLLDVTLFPDRDKAVSNLIAVFSQIWKNFWGARMESAFEAALKTLYEVNEAEVAADPQDGPDRQFTLLDVTALLTYTAFRHGLLGRVRDSALLDYWVRFEALQPRFQQEIITPVTTKLDKFANSMVARRIVGQGRSTLNIAEAIRHGQVLLVKTARGIVGHDIAALMGATLLGLLQVTVGEQAHLATGSRKRMRVIVDEFQVLQGVDFGAMLAELRKFGASFALATQALAYLDEVDRTLRPTVMANVDQLFCYAMSAEDARIVERELDGVVATSDLIALDDFHCYARLTVYGQRVPVFSLALDPPILLEEPQRTQAEELRRRSQRRLGRAADQVDRLVTNAATRRKAIATLIATSGSIVATAMPQRTPERMSPRSPSDGDMTNIQPILESGETTMMTTYSTRSSEPGEFEESDEVGTHRQRSKQRRSRRRRTKNPPFTSLLLAECSPEIESSAQVKVVEVDDGEDDNGIDEERSDPELEPGQ